MKTFVLTTTISMLALSALSAQENSKFTFDVGAGFTTPVGNTGRNLDNPGWNVRGGVGFNVTPYAGVLLNLGYDSFGITSSTLNTIGAPAGDTHVFSASIDPIVHLNPKGHFDVYITGGGGLYHWYQEFTQPTVGYGTGFSPFFGYYPYAYGANQILSSYSVNKPGVDIGAGVAMGTKWRGKFFAEAKYARIFMGNGSHADYLPVSFGYRW